MTRAGVQKASCLLIKDVELHEVMRQPVIVDGMLGIHPLTIHYVTAAEDLMEC